ncbi:hypothetical protein FSP39_007087 [Pinctada imbricata]|uniref:G-protein coupled receptors family 1 profile domain-containing protein n=1 Tax=Pinctada imbricata TaxID=66713 RepID=A0AA88XEZ7_PINIB|nr:hypothetical protein FSP39_007087 [Pinctada imbricata]
MLNTTFLNDTDPVFDDDTFSLKRVIPITILTSLVGFLAIVGNGLVLIVLGKNPTLLESTRKFCIHLAVTDLGNGFLTFLFSLIAFDKNEVAFCFYMLTLVKFLVFASQAIVTVNTIERYVGICKRHAYSRYMTKSSVCLMLLLAWIYAIVLTSVSFIGQSSAEALRLCYYHLMFRKWVYIVEAAMMFSLSALNIILFSFIMITARKFYKRVSPAALQGTSNAAVRNKAMQRSIRNGKMMGIVTVAFLACWMPYNVFQIYFGIGGTVTNSLLSAANTMYFIGVCNSTINPFIYVWQKKEFRDQCKKILNCRQQQDVVINLTNVRRIQEDAIVNKPTTSNQQCGGTWTTQAEINLMSLKKNISFDEESISTIEID